MIRQYKDWMRDNWNHPSVVVWDANNETKDAMFGDTIIPAVRPLDLSQRPWENSYNLPADPNDPVEYHPYLMSGGRAGTLTFKMSDLETMDGKPHKGALPSDTNPPLINEYGWLWLNRDGSPTLLTENVYAQLMGRDVTPRQRLDMYAYLLGGQDRVLAGPPAIRGHHSLCLSDLQLSWRLYGRPLQRRHEAGIGSCLPGLRGRGVQAVGRVREFLPAIPQGGRKREFTVMMVNDEGTPVHGRLTLSLETRSGELLASTEHDFAIAELGSQTYPVSLEIPERTAIAS